MIEKKNEIIVIHADERGLKVPALRDFFPTL